MIRGTITIDGGWTNLSVLILARKKKTVREMGELIVEQRFVDVFSSQKVRGKWSSLHICFWNHQLSTLVYLVVWGPVLWDSMGAPKYQSLSQGDPRNPNHRAPNHQFSMRWNYIVHKVSPIDHGWITLTLWEFEVKSFLFVHTGVSCWYLVHGLTLYK